MSGIYTVSQLSKQTYNIIDAEKGTIVNRLILQDGEALSGPIVVGDRCTFIVKTGPSQQFGVIYSLPKGTIINKFPA
jgi:hypothetical protein